MVRRHARRRFTGCSARKAPRHQVQLDGAATEADTAAAQKWLDTVLENSGGPLLRARLATLGGITGHAVIRINTLNAGPVPPAPTAIGPSSSMK